jgi:small subunit ribosomal protein S2
MKLEKNLGSISDMTRLPGAIFVVDIKRENIAVKEAQKLNIPIFAMVDTNSDPRQVDYVIPANDDASKSILKILTNVTEAIAQGLAERKAEKNAKTEGNDTTVKAEVKETAKTEVETKAKVETKETVKAEVETKAKVETKETAKTEGKTAPVVASQEEE